MPTLTKGEIFEKVKLALVDALSVEEDEIKEEASLTQDLGAESIDFLDIIFRLEKTFSIKIPQEELTAQNILSNPEYVVDRRLNAAGLAALRQAMPHVDLSDFEQDPDIDRFRDTFTVGAIVRFLEAKLAAS